MYQPYCKIIEWREDFANIQRGVTGRKHLACILRSRGLAICELVSGEPKISCPTGERAHDPNNFETNSLTREESVKISPSRRRWNFEDLRCILNDAHCERRRQIIKVLIGYTFFAHGLHRTDAV